MAEKKKTIEERIKDLETPSIHGFLFTLLVLLLLAVVAVDIVIYRNQHPIMNLSEMMESEGFHLVCLDWKEDSVTNCKGIEFWYCINVTRPGYLVDEGPVNITTPLCKHGYFSEFEWEEHRWKDCEKICKLGNWRWLK